MSSLLLLLLVSTASATVISSGLTILEEVAHILNGDVDKLTAISSCPEIDEKAIPLKLYTRANRDVPVILTPKNFGSLVANREVKYIVHNWLENATTSWVLHMKSAYLSRGDYAVVVVDWSDFALTPYSVAYCFLPKIGRAVGIFLDVNKADLSRSHIIGYSLGAHLAGFIGQELRLLNSGKRISRITGLDPSSPLFCESSNPLGKLSHEHARQVDVYHTDDSRFACSKRQGSIDIYINCGKRQPGCRKVDLPKVLNLEVINEALCNHQSSYKYFISTIYKNTLAARRCPFCILLPACRLFNNKVIDVGENLHPAESGVYYATTDIQPYLELFAHH